MIGYDRSPLRTTPLEAARRYRRLSSILEPAGISPNGTTIRSPMMGAKTAAPGFEGGGSGTPGGQPRPTSPRDPMGVPSQNQLQPPSAGGYPTPPPGATPGTPEWEKWLKGTFQEELNPGSVMSEILQLGNMVGGFHNPYSVLGKTPANMWALGNRATKAGMGVLDKAGVGIGSQPLLTSPKVGMASPNFDTFNTVAGYGANLGREAAGYIPDQPVRGITQLQNEIFGATPGAQNVVDAANPVLAGIQADAEAGYGLMGIPMSQVENMQAQNIAQANLAQDAALSSLSSDLADAGTYGSGAGARAINNEFATAYAPARISAMQDPLELAYKLGPDVLNAASGAISKTSIPLTELATSANLSDLDRQLKAGLGRSDVFGELARAGIGAASDLTGTQLKANQSAYGDQAQLDFQTEAANLDAWLKQQGLLANPAFNNPWKGFDAARGIGNDQNDLAMNLIKTALGEAGSLRGYHQKRQKNQWDQMSSIIGAVTGGLGNAAAGIGDLASGFAGGGGGGTGMGLIGAGAGDFLGLLGLL